MTRSSSSRPQRVLAAGRRCAHLCSRCRKCSVFPERNRTCPTASLRRLRQFPSLQWRSRDRWLSRWLAELKVTPTRRPQESFWLPAHKLKPQRGSMLLLAVEKFEAVSWDYFSSFV